MGYLVIKVTPLPSSGQGIDPGEAKSLTMLARGRWRRPTPRRANDDVEGTVCALLARDNTN